MTAIENYDCYTSRMEETFEDKAWAFKMYKDKLDTVDIIIDYGCADGAFYEFLSTHNYITTNQTYVGVDDNVEMRLRARNKYRNDPGHPVFLKPNWETLKLISGGHRSLLLLNSVLHEVYAYGHAGSVSKFLTNCNELNATYIAIRDMHQFTSSINVDWEDLRESMIKKMPKEFGDMVKPNCVISNESYFLNEVLEFSLKWMYKENWARESQELYLHNWIKGTDAYLHNYIKTIELNFNIPYITKKCKDEFGLALETIPTHKKVFYERID